MVDGVNLDTGQSALKLLIVSEESRPKPEPALTLRPTTVELTAKDKAPRQRIATIENVQVK